MKKADIRLARRRRQLRVQAHFTELIYFGSQSKFGFSLPFQSGRTTILEYFSTRSVADLAKNLAQDLAKRYPPAIANNPAQIASQQRLSGIFEEIFAKAAKFGLENRLGWYKRARLGNGFRWELNEMGYDRKFIDSATEGLTLCMNRNPSIDR